MLLEQSERFLHQSHRLWMSHSNTGRNATVKTLLETNKAIRKIKQEQVEIKYFGLGYPSRIKVVVYVNGSQGSLSSNFMDIGEDFGHVVASMAKEVI